jgi:hypothetical protein
MALKAWLMLWLVHTAASFLDFFTMPVSSQGYCLPT